MRSDRPCARLLAAESLTGRAAVLVGVAERAAESKLTAPRMETAHAGGCWKKTYTSRAKALLDIDRIRISSAQHVQLNAGKKRRKLERARREHEAVPCRAYVCPNCGLWHLTSQASKR